MDAAGEASKISMRLLVFVNEFGSDAENDVRASSAMVMSPNESMVVAHVLVAWECKE